MKRKIESGVFLAVVFLLCTLTEGVAQRGSNQYLPAKPDNLIDRVRFDEEGSKAYTNLSGPYTGDALFGMNPKSGKRSDTYWRIFSDRSGNVLFKDDKLTEPSKHKAEIGQKLYVIDESPIALKVLAMTSDPYTDGSYETAKVEMEGWIPKKKTLLWERPLISENSSFEMKAFLMNVNDRELLEEFARKGKNKDLVELYKAPDSGEPMSEKQLYEVLFVFKYDQDSRRYLVANDAVIGGYGYELFWVSESRIKVWNTRLALEWNFDESACEERLNNKAAVVFSDPARAVEYGKGEFQPDFGGKDDFLDAKDPCSDRRLPAPEVFDTKSQRYVGSVIRYPFFESRPGYYVCGALTRFDPKSMITIDNWEATESEIDNKLEKGSRVNIMFCINGSYTARKNAESYAKLIDKARNSFERDTVFQGKVRVGATIFYDHKRKTPPLTIGPFADRSGIEDVKKAVGDPKNYTAEPQIPLLYHGMNEAIERGAQEGETNVVIVLGGSSDVFHRMMPVTNAEANPFYLREQDLRSAIKKYNAHVLAVQVDTEGDYAAFYSEFRNHMRTKVLGEIVKEVDEDYARVAEFADAQNLSYPQWQAEDNTVADNVRLDVVKDYHLEYAVVSAIDTRDDFAIGSATAEDLVVDFTKRIAEKERVMLQNLYKVVRDHSEWKSFIGSAGQEVVKSHLLQGFSDDQLKQLFLEKVQLLYTGYTPKSIEGQTHHLYDQVLFMSRQDLQEMRENIQRIKREALDARRQRKGVVDAWYGYGAAILKEDIAALQKNFPVEKSKDLQRLLLSGVPELGMHSSMFSKYSAVEILTEGGKVQGEDIDAYLNGLEAKERNISELLRSANLEYRTGSYTFFWVPIEYLP